MSIVLAEPYVSCWQTDVRTCISLGLLLVTFVFVTRCSHCLFVVDDAQTTKIEKSPTLPVAIENVPCLGEAF